MSVKPLTIYHQLLKDYATQCQSIKSAEKQFYEDCTNIIKEVSKELPTPCCGFHWVCISIIFQNTKYKGFLEKIESQREKIFGMRLAFERVNSQYRQIEKIAAQIISIANKLPPLEQAFSEKHFRIQKFSKAIENLFNEAQKRWRNSFRNIDNCQLSLRAFPFSPIKVGDYETWKSSGNRQIPDEYKFESVEFGNLPEEICESLERNVHSMIRDRARWENNSNHFGSLVGEEDRKTELLIREESLPIDIQCTEESSERESLLKASSE